MGSKPGSLPAFVFRGADWCHVCGGREHPTVEVYFCENAEHDSGGAIMLRVCARCGERIASHARAGTSDGHALRALAARGIWGQGR